MAQGIFKDIRRASLDEFASDPRDQGGVCIFQDDALFDAVNALADDPASMRTSPNTEAFSDQVLRVSRQLYDRTGWDVVPHFILAVDVGDRPLPLHTDWEGATFADARTFTLWVPQSNFDEPHLMLLRPEVWAPPNCEFILDESGLYGRTMLHDDIYRRYSTYENLGVLEVSLKKGEILAFNGAIPHCTHPETPRERSSVSFRCPSNLGSLDEPRLNVNVTSPYGHALLSHTESVPVSPLLRSVDGRRTVKGYYEVDFAVRKVERRARRRHVVRRVRRMAPLRSLLGRRR
ncbi:MAG: hypothetical protein VX252_13605 [Myxococcota bacterium]|nr:hypothetical protein [Myxococcota bacterium]